MNFVKLMPGVKFTVRDNFPIKFGSLLPGSTGFISYVNFGPIVKRVKYLAVINIILTRKGKKGKARFETLKVKVPTFYDEKLAEENPAMFDKIYDTCPVITTDTGPINLTTLSNYDFAAWMLAYRNYVHVLITHNIPNGVVKLPKKHKHLFNLANLYYNRFYEEGPQTAFESLGDIQHRRDIIKSIRKIEAKATKHVLKHKNRCKALQESTISELLAVYTKCQVSQKFSASAKAVKSLIQRDGIKFSETLTL